MSKLGTGAQSVIGGTPCIQLINTLRERKVDSFNEPPPTVTPTVVTALTPTN